MNCSLVVGCVLLKAGYAQNMSNVPTLGVHSKAKCKADVETLVYVNGRSWKSLSKFKKCYKNFNLKVTYDKISNSAKFTRMKAKNQIHPVFPKNNV